MPQQALRETIRVEGGRLPLLDRHLMRLASGGCDSDMLSRAQCEAIAAAAKWHQPFGKMRLLVTPSGGVMVDIVSDPSAIAVTGGPLPVLVESVDPPLPPGGAKPADRTFWDLPQQVAKEQGGDLAVLIAPEDTLIDGSNATVWLVFGDRILTPTSPPALAGVSRSVLLELAEGLGLTAEEATLSRQDFERAEEVFFTTAVHGAAPAFGRGGPVTDSVIAAFDSIFTG